MLRLTCKTCKAIYSKPKNFKTWNDKHRNIFFEMSLTYCDKCRRKKQDQAFEKLNDVIKIIASIDADKNT